MNRPSLKLVTVRKRRSILPGVGGECLKSAVAHDAGIVRHLDEKVLKTRLEAERSVSFIFPGNEHARSVNVVKSGLRNRDIGPENDENPKGDPQLDHIFANHLNPAEHAMICSARMEIHEQITHDRSWSSLRMS
jgi:hypothetical protein